MTDRRRFIQQSSALIGGATLLSALDNKAFAILKNRYPAADQINIGAIGIKGMGWANVTSALKQPGVNLVAICDVDSRVIADKLADLKKIKPDAKVKTYSDYRKLPAL